ncbi:Flp pilus assembly protein TadB [Nocardioides daedukensis]|uniref:Flp pilus assembly protein TadB n=1 Tax=Nocardioides daedukensis TaxID=634462 RepID=A0A7Y9UNW8_9ACTN|nr:type II secretion system F family protein [Nocardioides daedukensis]NYG58978.1 Flp pilus assembly protein TadB [Nocardioides daedukensis]
MSAVLCAVLIALAAAVVWPGRSSPPLDARAAPTARPGESVLVRHRMVLALVSGLAGVTLVGGVVGWVVAAAVSAGVWTTIGRMEPAGVREDRAQAARELPHVIQLLAMVLASGAALPDAVRQVTRALPGPATAALRRSEARLSVGVAPELVWSELARQPGFERVGRALARAHGSGVPVAEVVRRLGVDLAREARADAEDRARTVGVRAALPLGLCLLPAFLLVGIVPVVVASMQAVAW